MARRKTTIDRNPLATLSSEASSQRAARAERVETTPRRVVAAWTRGTGSILEAVFEAQQAALAAGLTMFDATVEIDRAALADAVDLLQRAQEATRTMTRSSP